jgi:hypothetical protein
LLEEGLVLFWSNEEYLVKYPKHSTLKQGQKKGEQAKITTQLFYNCLLQGGVAFVGLAHLPNLVTAYGFAYCLFYQVRKCDTFVRKKSKDSGMDGFKHLEDN